MDTPETAVPVADGAAKLSRIRLAELETKEPRGRGPVRLTVLGGAQCPVAPPGHESKQSEAGH